jgi:hypothetical protein
MKSYCYKELGNTAKKYQPLVDSLGKQSTTQQEALLCEIEHSSRHRQKAILEEFKIAGSCKSIGETFSDRLVIVPVLLDIQETKVFGILWYQYRGTVNKLCK